MFSLIRDLKVPYPNLEVSILVNDVKTSSSILSSSCNKRIATILVPLLFALTHTAGKKNHCAWSIPFIIEFCSIRRTTGFCCVQPQLYRLNHRTRPWTHPYRVATGR